jgi:hypothetical protein
VHKEDARPSHVARRAKVAEDVMDLTKENRHENSAVKRRREWVKGKSCRRWAMHPAYLKYKQMATLLLLPASSMQALFFLEFKEEFGATLYHLIVTLCMHLQ